VKTGSNIAYVTLALYDWGDPPHCGDQGPPGNEAEVIPFTLHAKVAGLTGDHRHGVQAQGCSKGAAFLLGRRDGRVKLGDPPRTFLVGEDGGEPHVKIEALTLHCGVHQQRACHPGHVPAPGDVQISEVHGKGFRLGEVA
jgi:hypothetical protein